MCVKRQHRGSSLRLWKPLGVLALVALCGVLPSTASAAVPGLERVGRFSNWSSWSSRSVEVACPSGKRTLAAGATTVGAAGKVVLRGVRPNMHGVAVYAEESGSGTSLNWTLGGWAICADPLPGHEYRSSYSPYNSTSQKFASASCSTDAKRALGGGAEVLGGSRAVKLDGFNPQRVLYDEITLRYTDKVTGWAQEYPSAFSGNWMLFAHAICADRLPGYQVVRRASTWDSSTYKALSASCPSGKRVVGFGGTEESAYYVVGGAAVLTSIAPDSALTSVTARGVKKPGSTRNWRLHAKAVCAYP